MERILLAQENHQVKKWILFFVAGFLPCLLVHAIAVGQSIARPNILFIAIDDLKPVLGCYGNEIAITPNIDRLAAGGVVFQNAHCQWPVCGPTRASLMTSLRPEANGVMNLKTSMRAKNPNILTLPQHFKNNGYVTAGTGKIYDPRCVDDRATLDEPSWSIPFTKLPSSKIKHGAVKQVVMAPEVDDRELTDGQIAWSGLELMRKLDREDQPFFLAVGFKKPHLPFVAPKKYWDMYDPSKFKLASHRGGIENASGFSIHDSPEYRGYQGVPESGEITEELQRRSIHGYFACTTFIDAQIGMLLDELEKLELSKNTVIVLWGDHGFHLGDHGMWGKHSTLEQATRVPLIIRPHSGARIAKTSTPVEFTDIFPTLCDLAGLSYPSRLNGRSLMPVISGASKKIREGALTVFRSKGAVGYSYRTERYRYTEWINKFGKVIATEMYDYETDPFETRSIAAKPSEKTVRTRLASQLRADAQGCERLFHSR